MNHIEIVPLILFIVFLLIWSVGISKGFNLRQKSGWFYVLSGFLAGTSLGLTRSELQTGLELGSACAVIAILGGTYIYWLKNRFRKVGDNISSRNKH